MTEATRRSRRRRRVGETTVGDDLRRAHAAGLTWAEASAMTDAEVEARLFSRVGQSEPPARVPVDFAWVHRELSRVGVTLQTLWVEYREGAAAAAPLKPYEYSRFCDPLRAAGGEARDVDAAGASRGREALHRLLGEKAPHRRSNDRRCDRVRGLRRRPRREQLHLCRGDAYAEARRLRRVRRCVPSSSSDASRRSSCPDQLRSAVSGPDRYEPDINPSYLELAQHYGVTVIPARPRKPKDKAKVEGGVLIVQRWIIAALRNRTFFSLAELNAAIRELVEKLNARPFKKLDGCRRSAFEAIDRPAMRPLPARRYELAEWRHAKVNIDYCVTVRPSPLQRAVRAGRRVPSRSARRRASIEVLHKSVRVASHARHHGPKGASRSPTSTGRARTASTANGRLSVSLPGPRASADTSVSSRARSWPAVRTLRPGTARVSASSVLPIATAASALTPRAPAPFRSAARASRPCSPS